jgi:hypothetical protein
VGFQVEAALPYGTAMGIHVPGILGGLILEVPSHSGFSAQARANQEDHLGLQILGDVKGLESFKFFRHDSNMHRTKLEFYQKRLWKIA